jgi:hypothetical protein
VTVAARATICQVAWVEVTASGFGIGFPTEENESARKYE